MQLAVKEIEQGGETQSPDNYNRWKRVEIYSLEALRPNESVSGPTLFSNMNLNSSEMDVDNELEKNGKANVTTERSYNSKNEDLGASNELRPKSGKWKG
ncbi:hypothetical protein QYF36_001869 [Acer negundo]|nr:hypothetical protein QYF36_001869 [Acer negundo]